MDACGCDADGFASIFDRRNAEHDRDRYRRNGPDRTTRMLLELLAPYRSTGSTVLDIGGGIGIIDHELLRAGAGHAVLVDGSTASLEVARQEARRLNLLDRIEFVEGDFVRRAAAIDPADIVTLDRVICCYPDAEGLVGLSAARVRTAYGLVLPRDRSAGTDRDPPREPVVPAAAEGLSGLRPSDRADRRDRGRERTPSGIGRPHALLAGRGLRPPRPWRERRCVSLPKQGTVLSATLVALLLVAGCAQAPIRSVIQTQPDGLRTFTVIRERDGVPVTCPAFGLVEPLSGVLRGDPAGFPGETDTGSARPARLGRLACGFLASVPAASGAVRRSRLASRARRRRHHARPGRAGRPRRYVRGSVHRAGDPLRRPVIRTSGSDRRRGLRPRLRRQELAHDAGQLGRRESERGVADGEFEAPDPGRIGGR